MKTHVQLPPPPQDKYNQSLDMRERIVVFVFSFVTYVSCFGLFGNVLFLDKFVATTPVSNDHLGLEDTFFLYFHGL